MERKRSAAPSSDHNLNPQVAYGIVYRNQNKSKLLMYQKGNKSCLWRLFFVVKCVIEIWIAFAPKNGDL